MGAARATKKEQVERRRREYTEKFFPYVEKVARRLARRLPAHVDHDDLVASGVVGLMEAAERFDPKRADRFEQFAEFRIRGAMLDQLRSYDTLSRDMRRLSNHLREATRALEGQLGRVPAPDELAAHLGIAVDELYTQQKKLSGASVIGIEDAGPDFLQHAADARAVDPAEAMERREVIAYLSELVEDLPERMQKVLSLYYVEDLTLLEIGDLLGITESRVCQIVGDAERRLREELVPLLAN
jgi:RNA polymerase sigma factor for flagellar operon FliA